MIPEIMKWPDIFKEYDLRMNLFSIYIFFEIGGTGGGCFRYMYSRFLEESARITRDNRLSKSAKDCTRADDLFSEIGLLFKELEKASRIFHAVAEFEENIYSELSSSIK